MCEILKWAPFISAAASTGALIFVGLQYRTNNRLNRRNSYLSLLQNFFNLNQMVIKEPTLSLIYSTQIETKDLKPEQKYYIFSVISLCEAIFLLNEVRPFPLQIPDSSWEGYIINQINTKTIKDLWNSIEKDIADGKMKREFSLEFVNWVNSRITI